MKKFLFTLVALFMAGSLLAEDNYMYIEDFQVTQEFLAQTSAKKRRVTVSVKADFPEYVSAWQLFWDLPEGISVYALVPGTTYDLTYMNAMEQDITFTPGLSVDMNNNTAIAAVLLEQGYYYEEGMDPDEDDPVSYGNPKWLGQYEDYLQMTLQFEMDFAGGDLTLTTEPSSTNDPRGPICPKGTSIQKVCHITVEGGSEPVQTPAPEINVTPGDDAYIFEAVGEGVVTLFLDGNEVENPYTVVRTTEDQIVKFTAVAHVDGQTDGTVTGEYLVPALPIKDLTGDIEISDPDENGVVTITYNGDEEVTIVVTVNGEEVVLGEDGTITVAEGESEIVVVVSADGYNDLTGGKTVTYVVPEPPVEQTADPTFEIVDDPEAQTVTVIATGDGHITILWDEQLVAEGDGEAVWVIPYGDDPEGEEYGFTVYAQEDGKEMSNPVNGEVVVPGKTVEPEQTPAPEIIVDVQDEVVIITVEGEGELHLYINGEEVDYPVEIARGNEDVVITVSATAQGEDMLISETVTAEVTIPALAETPEDPEGHMTGYWVVLIDKDGNEVWKKLENTDTDDPNQYLTNVALHYSQYGGKPLSGDMTDADNPMVPFFFMVDGVRYSCEIDETEPVYGNANENPLYEVEENMWNVPVGYFYTVGVLINPETGDLYLQISKGLYTGIDEMNGDKTVAGVRYFNMAGQEMSEANGMTIVVTTYTDGTTNAVKVMK